MYEGTIFEDLLANRVGLETVARRDDRDYETDPVLRPMKRHGFVDSCSHARIPAINSRNSLIQTVLQFPLAIYQQN